MIHVPNYYADATDFFRKAESDGRLRTAEPGSRTAPDLRAEKKREQPENDYNDITLHSHDELTDHQYYLLLFQGDARVCFQDTHLSP